MVYRRTKGLRLFLCAQPHEGAPPQRGLVLDPGLASLQNTENMTLF